MLVTFHGYGQDKIEKANEAFNNKSFMEAAAIYEKVAEKGYKSEELMQNIGDSYYFNGKYTEASKWYKELFLINERQDKQYILRYAQSLKSTGNTELGNTYFNAYASELEETSPSHISADRYMELIEENSGRYNVSKVPFNSNGMDFGTSFLGDDKIVFASTRDNGVLFNRISSWDGLPYLDLYLVNIDGNESYGKPKVLNGTINERYHESTACYTKDGKTMYFTRTNPKKSEDGNNLLHLKIYKATESNGKWENVEELSINGEDFNTAHPMLSPKEDKLYFASDRLGGYGNTDLYYVNFEENGELGTVVNLGETINTPGRESFPFISDDNALYFSSEGHFGLGGYDVFYTKITEEGELTGNILNVGKPINSNFDDICYITKANKGFFSSNRADKENESLDNIYSFTENTPIKEVYLKSILHGIVTDKTTELPIAGATIAVLDTENNLIQSLTTDAQGAYSTDVAYIPAYILKVTKENYSSTDDFSKEAQKDREHNFQLDSKNGSILPGANLADVLNIPIIYFDFDKWNIRPDSEIELQKVVEALKLYPALKIDVRSHTDSRGNDAYNLDLSDKRAKSTMNYLIAQGISKDRLTSKGYGESKLVNKCSNGIACSKADHELNRRSEFIVLKR